MGDAGQPEPEMHESTELGTIKALLTKYGNDPNYRVKSKTSKFQGYSVQDLEKARDEILRRRGELPEPAPSPLYVAPWEMEGSGLGAPDAADKLIHQLHASLGSINAGNTSEKLRNQVVDLLQLLTNHGVINEYQRKKIFRDYISP